MVLLIYGIYREKADQATKLRSLEAILMNGGVGDMGAFTATAASSTEGGEGGEGGEASTSPTGEPVVNKDGTTAPAPANVVNVFMSMQKLRDDNHTLTDQIHFLEQEVTRLQSYADDAAYLEDSKNAFEEYQVQTSEELEEERSKLVKETQNLQHDRSTLLAERGHLSEKETRVNALLGTLDERESKLRQHLLTLKDQQEQWQRSVADLQRREDLVEDWSRNHSSKEKKLQETEDALAKKATALRVRDDAVAEAEMKGKQHQKELDEKETKFQHAMAKVGNMEHQLVLQEEKNQATEVCICVCG